MKTPKYLLCDNDSKFGLRFARAAVTSGIKMLTTPSHAKRPNAICERFLLSVRRECLEHVLIFHEKHLHRVLHVYVKYFHRARPHQGIQQHRVEEVSTMVNFQDLSLLFFPCSLAMF